MFWPDDLDFAHVPISWLQRIWFYILGGLFHSEHRYCNIVSGFQEHRIKIKLLMDRLGDDVIIHNQKLNGLKEVL